MEYKNIFYVAATVVEFYFFTGLFFGWPNFSKIFLQENFFACDDEAIANNATATGSATGNPTAMSNGTRCESQTTALTSVFVTSSTCFSVTGLAAGIIYDRMGTAVTRLTANVLLIGGVLLLIFAQPGQTDM